MSGFAQTAHIVNSFHADGDGVVFIERIRLSIAAFQAQQKSARQAQGAEEQLQFLKYLLASHGIKHWFVLGIAWRIIFDIDPVLGCGHLRYRGRLEKLCG